MPNGLIAARQPVFFYCPGLLECSWNFTYREAVNTLAHAGACRIRGRRNISMVAEIMIDRKMAVSRKCQDDLSQQFFNSGVFVTEFVASVDSEAAGQAGHYGNR